MNFETDKEKIIIYPSITKYIGFSVFTFIFMLISLLLIFVGFKINLGFSDISIKEGYSHSFIAFIGIIGFSLFAFMFTHFFRRTINRKPSVIIDNNGILDNASATSAGYINWNDIEDIAIFKQKYKFWEQKVLGIKIKNKEEFVSQFKGMKKIIIKASVFPINIPQNAIDYDIDVLYRNIQSHRPQVGSRVYRHNGL